MLNLTSLIRGTTAYKTLVAEKSKNRLSHAYLVTCQDKKFLLQYLKILCKIIICDENEYCNTCRNCRLIENGAHPDVMFYPKTEGNVATADINNLTEESYVKPVEGDKKLFVIVGAETMNAPAQNKLLKTLEEPPKNVIILLGATSEFTLLPTIKSRVKKLEISNFAERELYSILSAEYGESEKLKQAVSCSDGTLGKAIELYNGEDLEQVTSIVKEVLLNMKTAKDVLYYSNLLASSKIDFGEFLSVLELAVRDIMAKLSDGEKSVFNTELSKELENVQGFTLGSAVYALEKINEAYKRKKFNNNQTMLSEWLLFSILEGKHKWQKL